jgi:hypothetical protein
VDPNTGNDHFVQSLGGNVVPNSWQHVAMTYDKTTGILTLYRNGLVLTNSNVGVWTPSTAFDLYFGKRSAGIFAPIPYQGLLDEISLYSRALSSNEIAAIYSAGSAGKCPASTPTTNDCVPPPAGIVGWWPAEGNPNDVIGGDDGTLEGGATFAPGKVGLGFRLDGTNGYVQIPDSAALKPTNVTVEAWVWLDPSVSPADEQIVFKQNSWSYLFEGYSLLKEHDANGDGTFTDRFSFVVTRNGDQVVTRSTTSVQRGVWYHVAGTYDGNRLTLWVNGVAEDSLVAGFPLDYGTEPIYIGTTHTFAPYINMFAGIIDEVSIYDRALSTNEIQAIYNAGSAGKCTSGSPSGVPQISYLTPTAATNGAVVTISGNNFNPNSAGDVVYFGAVQANVLLATPTTLVVTVPVGSTYAPVSVTVNGLTAYSSQLFEPTFLGNGSTINSSSFGPRLDLPSGNGPNKVVIADLDGDGKPDLIVSDDYNNTISLYQNISTNGLLTASSFAPRVDIATPPGQYSPYGLAVADVDGDGKLDIIVSDYDKSIISVYRNTCTPGNITSNAFATRVDFACGLQPQGIEVRDIDGDGRPDILTANRGDGTVSILRNTSQVGILTTNSFAPHVDISTGSSCDSVVVGDLDGDGKPDVAVANTGDGTVSVLRNISSPGSITTNSFAPKVDITIAGGLIQMAIGDLDGDGKLDLIVAAYTPETVYVLRNTSTAGNLSFAQPVDFSLGGWGHSPILADLNGDGKPDLAVVTELNSLLSVFQNISAPGSITTNSLAPRVDFGTGWNAWGVAAGDLDGDGRPDLVFCNTYDNTISIYQNQIPLSSNSNNPPVITSQPANQAVPAGSSATFSVTATGIGVLAYQWKFDGTNISGATNATLTLTNLHPSQAGNYTVSVSDSGGSITSSNATLTVTVQNLLVYNYFGNEKITTAKQEFSYNYSGELFLVPSSTNGFFVGWGNLNGQRQYWVAPFSGYLLITVPGAGNHVYTVIGKAGDEIDYNGQPHIWSYLHKGQNALLTIGKGINFSFPDIFSCSDNHVYPDPQTGNMILREATSIYQYTEQTTQTANNNKKTVTDLVNALTAALTNQGYKKQ